MTPTNPEIHILSADTPAMLTTPLSLKASRAFNLFRLLSDEQYLIRRRSERLKEFEIFLSALDSWIVLLGQPNMQEMPSKYPTLNVYRESDYPSCEGLWNQPEPAHFSIFQSRLSFSSRRPELRHCIDARLEQLEQRDPDKLRCTLRRLRPQSPFSPAFDSPPPQDLEDLILQQARLRRRLRVIASFRTTHYKFGDQILEHMTWKTPEDRNSRMTCHQVDPKQAWKDGVDAARRLLSGDLPRELHSVLGIAQLASAIRPALDDVDAPAASEDRFLFDLGRWRQLLPSDTHAAFDYYADLLWDNRPPSDTAWKEPHDAETLVYFQDLLMDMLSQIEASPPERTELESAPPSSDMTSYISVVAKSPLSSSKSTYDEGLPEVESALNSKDRDGPESKTFAELALYTAGAIFALILAFSLCKSPQLILRNAALTF
jgi:hypothetical protein